MSMMIGMSGSGKAHGERTVRTKSRPFGLGISQSRMTTSGPKVQIASSPELPSLASRILVMPIASNSERATLRMISSSSTMSTFKAMRRCAISYAAGSVLCDVAVKDARLRGYLITNG
jgi:hypothetical protein